MRQCWKLILASVSVLNIYMHFHDDQVYLNSLDVYTLYTVHWQDSVVVRHMRTNYMHAIVCTLYNMKHDRCVHSSWSKQHVTSVSLIWSNEIHYLKMRLSATHEYFTKFLEWVYSHTHATVKFKLRCTIVHRSIVLMKIYSLCHN